MAGIERRHGEAGFTLVEALAAFAIVAILGLAIQRGLVQSRLGWLWIDDREAAERVARSILAEPVNLARAADAGWSGSLDGHAYTVRLTQVNLPLPPGDPEPDAPVPAAQPQRPIRWLPLRWRIEVAATRGTVSLEAIRLCPFP